MRLAPLLMRGACVLRALAPEPEALDALGRGGGQGLQLSEPRRRGELGLRLEVCLELLHVHLLVTPLVITCHVLTYGERGELSDLGCVVAQVLGRSRSWLS